MDEKGGQSVTAFLVSGQVKEKMQLHSVVLELGKNKLTAVLSDSQSRRGVVLDWGVGGARTDIPPENWWDLVQAEAQFQQAEEAGIAAGRILPHE